MPEAVALHGEVVFDDEPVVLEPLVDPGKERASRSARFIDGAEEAGVDLPLLPFAVAAVGPALGLGVGDFPRGGHAELGDEEGVLFVVAGKVPEVPQVRVPAPGAFCSIVSRVVDHKVRVVGVGVVGCEEAAPVFLRGGELFQVDSRRVVVVLPDAARLGWEAEAHPPPLLFGFRRLRGMVERVKGRPVRPGDGALGVPEVRLVGDGVLRLLGEPALHGVYALPG